MAVVVSAPAPRLQKAPKVFERAPVVSNVKLSLVIEAVDLPRIFAAEVNLTVLLVLSISMLLRFSTVKPLAKSEMVNNWSVLSNSLPNVAVLLSAPLTIHLYGSTISPKVVFVPPLVTATL